MLANIAAARGGSRIVLFLLASLLSPLPALRPSAAPVTPAPYHPSPEQISAFERDGIIVVRGLLRGKELKDAVRAARRIRRSSSIPERILHRLLPVYGTVRYQTWRRHRALEAVAFDSAAPSLCAGLMGFSGGDNDGDAGDGEEAGRDAEGAVDLGGRRPVRLLKDALLGYCAGDAGCGWHVDDKIFWPCEDRDVGRRDAGINVWITLSPVSAKEGGGLAVAPGTHRAPFAREAREAIASRGHQTTCFLEKLRPDCHAKMEARKYVPDLEPGDAIVHNRYIFHRTDPFADPVGGKKAGAKLRISLRYVPADATFYDNGRERAIVEKGLSTGDKVSRGGEYYPQVWPTSLPEERGRKVPDERPARTWKATAQALSKRMMGRKGQ